MSRGFRLLAATSVVAIMAVAVAVVTGKATPPDARTRDVTSREAPAQAPDTVSQVRGAPTAPTSVVSTPAIPSHASAAPTATPADPIGHVVPVPATANPQVALVAAAIQAHDHPERLSALVQPPAFVPGSNAAAYATEVAPGRAFQSAKPGPGVPVLVPVGPTQMSMDQDGRTALRVRTQPGSPVTFTSFDLGHFDNSLATQTVLADAHGVASVAFAAGPGTIDDVHILAASPSASGQVPFIVTVMPTSHAQTAATAPTAPPLR